MELASASVVQNRQSTYRLQFGPVSIPDRYLHPPRHCPVHRRFWLALRSSFGVSPSSHSRQPACQL